MRRTRTMALVMLGVVACSAAAEAAMTGRLPASARAKIRKLKLHTAVAGAKDARTDRTEATATTTGRQLATDLGGIPAIGSTNMTGSPVVLAPVRKVEIISVVEGDQIAVDD